MAGDALDDPRYLTADGDADAVLRAVLEIASELWVLRDRFAVLEQLLEERGSVTREELEQAEPGPELAERLRGEREQLVGRLIAALTGEVETPDVDGGTA